MSAHLSLGDEWTRIARRQIVGLKVVFWSALVFGSLKALGFPTWFLLVLLAITVSAGTVVAGVWRGVSPGLGVTRRGRERTLRTLLKLEEAVLLANGALNTFIVYMRETGRPPEDPTQLERMKRGIALGTEVRAELDRLERGPRLRAVIEIAATGWSGIKRLGDAFNEAQRVAQLGKDALEILKAPPLPETVGRGTPDSAKSVRLIQLERETVAILARVRQLREEAQRAAAPHRP